LLPGSALREIALQPHIIIPVASRAEARAGKRRHLLHPRRDKIPALFLYLALRPAAMHALVDKAMLIAVFLSTGILTSPEESCGQSTNKALTMSSPAPFSG